MLCCDLGRLRCFVAILNLIEGIYQSNARACVNESVQTCSTVCLHSCFLYSVYQEQAISGGARRYT